MKLLLVYPRPTQESPQKTPPLSILYLGAYVARRGHEVRYFDERWDTDFQEKLDWSEVVGVSSMSGYQLGRALDFLKRAHLAGKTTIMGGVHCTLAPKTCVRESYIDYLVIGEGEQTLLELLDNLHCMLYPEIIKGIWAKTGVCPRGFYTGDRPPIPADEIESPIDGQTLKYFLLASETNDVMLPASRGCPYTCGFCINSTRESKNKWRPVPLNKWLEDIDRLRNARIPIPFLQIGDDWLGNKARIIEVGVALAARNIDWHLSIRANQVDLELVRNLKALRCVGVSIGAESGSDAILERMGKHIQVADTLRAARCLAEYGLKPLYYFIVGIPTETSEELRATMNLADKLYKIHRGNCSIVFYGYNPQPGTKLGELAASVGVPVPVSLSDWCNYDRSNTGDPLINAIYYVAGLRFHRTRGDKTDQNFPGIRRLLILPFELLCVLRWKLRFFRGFGWEQRSIKNLLSRATSA